MLRNGLKRKIIFTLGLLLDAYQEMSIRNFYRKLYSPLYERTTITETLSRMAKTGEIEKKLVKDQPIFFISAKGSKLLDEAIPLRSLSEKRWDGFWRIVIFDIEEKEAHTRDMIRRKLRNLGFAMWQESVYLSPHPVAEEMNEFFEEKDLIPRCICFEAKQPNIFSSQEFAQNIFNIDSLRASYGQLNDEINSALNEYEKKKINKDQAFKKLEHFMESFQNIIMNDPFLPNELTPNFTERNQTKKTLGEFSQYIAKR